MGECAERPLIDYVMPTIKWYRPAIWMLAIKGDQNFKIKTKTIQMIQQNQFSRAQNKYQNKHIANFFDMCDTLCIDNISTVAIWLHLFSFSLRDRTKSWLQSLPVDSITTWDKLCQIFFAKFFPFEKTVCLHNEIHNFIQWDNESLVRLGRDSKRCWGPAHTTGSLYRPKFSLSSMGFSHPRRT